MKSSFATGLFLLACASGRTACAGDAPGRAAAEDAAKKEKQKMPSYPALMQMKPEDVMNMMDKDKKGYVTHEEFMKFYEALFQRLDRDKNQQLTLPEFTDRG